MEITTYINNKLNMNIEPLGFSGPAVQDLRIDEISDTIYSNEDIYANKKIFFICKENQTNKLEEIIKKQNNIKEDTLSKINILSVNRIKGMEFRTAFIWDIDMSKQEKYVAMSRALERLYMLVA